MVRYSLVGMVSGMSVEFMEGIKNLPQKHLAVELLQRRNLRPVILLLMAQTFGGQAGSEELAARLERRGIPVCKIYNKANLGDVLAGFASQHQQQENRSWQPHPFTLST